MGQIKVTYNLSDIEGLCLIESTVHGDERGYFMETFSQKDMYEAGLYFSFVAAGTCSLKTDCRSREGTLPVSSLC